MSFSIVPMITAKHQSLSDKTQIPKAKLPDRGSLMPADLLCTGSCTSERDVQRKRGSLLRFCNLRARPNWTILRPGTGRLKSIHDPECNLLSELYVSSTVRKSPCSHFPELWWRLVAVLSNSMGLMNCWCVADNQ